MKRIDGAGATISNHWTVGDPAASPAVPATTVTDDYMNIVQEEIAYVIEHTGGALDQAHDYDGSPANDTTQLYVAIKKIVNAGGSGGVSTVTNGMSPYTAVITKTVIPCDTSAGAVVVNLPVATAVPGEIFEVSKVTGDVATVTITPNGTDLIIGANGSQVIANQWTVLRFRSLGALGWIIM